MVLIKLTFALLISVFGCALAVKGPHYNTDSLSSTSSKWTNGGFGGGAFPGDRGFFSDGGFVPGTGAGAGPWFGTGTSFWTQSPLTGCTGSATYTVTFHNDMTRARFGSAIPRAGLSFSPVTATTHSSRFSVLSVRGFASPALTAIAQTGDNVALLSELRARRRSNTGVRSVTAAAGPTPPRSSTSLTVRVNCAHPMISAVSMIAPSPDWFVHLSNLFMYSAPLGRFVDRFQARLIAFDAGTDSGSRFTDPSDPSLDIPTVPQQNIVPLIEDPTDRLGGRTVGWVDIRRV